jgi:hypothetical protein
VAASAALAHGPISTKLTWTREISRVVYKRCSSCHRPGGMAPMSLLGYDEARPWAKAIKEEVLERRMPPWGAIAGFGDLRDDRSLTSEERHMLADWVEGGAPEGDPKYLPEVPAAGELPAAGMLRGQRFRSMRTLRAPLVLGAIQVRDLPENAGAQVVVHRPDGTVQPLLWIYPYRRRWQWIYRYREPVRLPAGSRVEITPAGAGTVILAR